MSYLNSPSSLHVSVPVNSPSSLGEALLLSSWEGPALVTPARRVHSLLICIAAASWHFSSNVGQLGPLLTCPLYILDNLTLEVKAFFTDTGITVFSVTGNSHSVGFVIFGP